MADATQAEAMIHSIHELLYRGGDTLDRLAGTRITICGAGALGANIAESLARIGARRLRVVDRDRVEERNLSTQPYQRADIGAPKAKILSHMLYRAVGADVEALVVELSERNVAKLLRDSDIVVDAFDNSVARGIVTAYCRERGLPCLHAGLSGGYGEVIWNDRYRVPSSAGDDICDYPLARSIVIMTSIVACESLIAFACRDEERDHTITLEDLSIQPYSI